jgi:hypothetical protein
MQYKEKESVLCNYWNFVCLITPNSKIFHLYGDITIAGEGMQNLAYMLGIWGL